MQTSGSWSETNLRRGGDGSRIARNVQYSGDMTHANAGGGLHGSTFNVPDPRGVSGPDGHIRAAYDLFARAGAPVRSPVAGTVVEVQASHGGTGGAVAVQAGDGRVWVFRDVDPSRVAPGARVAAGQEIATVAPFAVPGLFCGEASVRSPACAAREAHRSRQF